MWHSNPMPLLRYQVFRCFWKHTATQRSMQRHNLLKQRVIGDNPIHANDCVPHLFSQLALPEIDVLSGISPWHILSLWSERLSSLVLLRLYSSRSRYMREYVKTSETRFQIQNFPAGNGMSAQKLLMFRQRHIWLLGNKLSRNIEQHPNSHANYTCPLMEAATRPSLGPVCNALRPNAASSFLVMRCRVGWVS